MVKRRFTHCIFIIVVLTVFGLGFGPRLIMAAEKTASMLTEDAQVLASGPLHEAFVKAVALDPEPGIVAPKTPPPLVNEIPPRQKPEGDAQWIPGYWAFDDEINEYIWVSGTWRIPPPDRQWVPGYWNSVSQGYQWIPGYWASVQMEETEYLPEPPESVEIGPSSNAPSSDYIWIPGCWLWRYGRYAWRPGYWAAVNPDWIWMPAHYNWTPRGYIFVDGYWDHTVIHRGVLFAPVYFPPRVNFGLTYSFSPGYVIDLTLFDDALFLRPRYSHYYYGDYYASRYYKKGIYPWFSLHARRVVYDPIFAHQRWRHRNDRKWVRHLETRFRERREHEARRPRRSIDHRKGPAKMGRRSGPESRHFVRPLDRAKNNKARANRFQHHGEKERRGFSRREKTVRKKTPPARYRTPKPNPNVEPLKRRYDSSRSGERSRMSEDKGRTSGSRKGQWEGRRHNSGSRQPRGHDGRKGWNKK
jgi:hypothetical protein